MRRTMLFLPGNSPNMIANGSFLGADSIILDLEDAVSPDNKDAARNLVKSALKHLTFGTCEVIVRINSLDTPYWEIDLEEVVPYHPDVIMPTKVSDCLTIELLVEKLDTLEQKCGLEMGSVKLLPLIETALGLEHAYSIASSSKRIVGLLLGAEDLTADLRCERTKEGREIEYARGRLVNAARAVGVEPYDCPFTAIADPEGLAVDTMLAKSLGFSGKAVINPRHVSRVNEIFSPTTGEIEYAKNVFAAIEEAGKLGKGAISLNGKMIDAPIVQRAKLVLEAARALEGVNT